MKTVVKIKDFRKQMKALGYTVKSKTVGFSDLARAEKLFVSVYDGKKLVNSGIMSNSHHEQYKAVFDVLNDLIIVK